MDLMEMPVLTPFSPASVFTLVNNKKSQIFSQKSWFFENLKEKIERVQKLNEDLIVDIEIDK